MKFGPVSLLLLLSLGTCPSRCDQSGDRGELSDPWEPLVRGLRRTSVDMVPTADVARVRSCLSTFALLLLVHSASSLRSDT
jgi:hypothetical protein